MKFIANPDELREVWNELMAVNDKWFASQSYRSCSFPMMTWSIRSHLAAAILLGTAVTEERAVFGIGDLMVFVTDLGTHCAHTYPSTILQVWQWYLYGEEQEIKDPQHSFWTLLLHSKGMPSWSITSAGSWIPFVWWWRCIAYCRVNPHPKKQETQIWLEKIEAIFKSKAQWADCLLTESSACESSSSTASSSTQSESTSIAFSSPSIRSWDEPWPLLCLKAFITSAR